MAMKHLAESISRGIRGHFPRNPEREEIIPFLERNGFQEIQSGLAVSTAACVILAKDSGINKWYQVGECSSGPGTWWVEFGDYRVSFVTRLENPYKPLEQFYDAFRKNTIHPRRIVYLDSFSQLARQAEEYFDF